MTTLGPIEDSAPVCPGDADRTQAERLSAAVTDVMWPQGERRYPTPVEPGERDPIADLTADEFLAGMPPIDARRG